MTALEEIAIGETLAGVIGKALDIFHAAKDGKVTPAEADAGLSTARAQLDESHAGALKNAATIIHDRFDNPTEPKP